MERIAALDIGLKRIGVALSLDGKSVLPQPPIFRKNRMQAARDVSAFLALWKVDRLVVGLPMEGSSAEEMGRRIRHFIDLIEFHGPTVMADESHTSLEACERMRGIVRHRKDGKSDSIAAMIILESYLLRLKSSNL